MKAPFAGGLLVLVSFGVGAASPWSFTPPESVTTMVGPGIFHHLESAGRRNIAVSDGTVAVVWEDNRDGGNRVYVAYRRQGPGFANEEQVSEGGAAFEPGLLALDGGRFLAGWEEDGRVRVRVVGPEGLGATLTVGGQDSGQVSLARGYEGPVVAAWSEGPGGHRRIMFDSLSVIGDAVRMDDTPCPVEAGVPPEDQLYPSVVVTRDGSPFLGWEDRRRGHTVITRARSERPCQFTAPAPLNDIPATRTVDFGRGSGAARVALARFGEDGVAAVWSDKRNFRTGYDVYGAVSLDGGRTFGPNQPVQDAFGDLTEQWHPAVAGDPNGAVVAAWDDNRDGTSDLWMTWLEGTGWNDNQTVPGASGPGEQTHPVMALDAEGNLHVAWVERDAAGGPTRLRYAFGRFKKD